MENVPVLHTWTQQANFNDIACAVETLVPLMTYLLTDAL
jgi:hypothetical protein